MSITDSSRASTPYSGTLNHPAPHVPAQAHTRRLDLMAHVALGECGDDAALTRRLHTSLGNQTPDDYEHHYCHTAGTEPALTT